MNLSKEPSVIVAGITAFVAAAINLLAAYGFDVSQDQQTALLAMTAVLAPLVAGLIIRFRVFSPSSTASIAQEAANTGKVPDAVK